MQPTRLVPRIPAQPVGLSRNQIIDRADSLAASYNRDAKLVAAVSICSLMGRHTTLADAAEIRRQALDTFCWQPKGTIAEPWDGVPRRFAERELPKLHQGRVRRSLRVIGGSLHHGLAVVLGSVLRVHAREEWDNDAA